MLETLVKTAWSTGKSINLDGIGYGRIHWGNRTDVKDEPSAYYYFLAGMVRELDARNILEIGTHWGGATRAMWTGLRDQSDALVTTVDISTESDQRLKDFPDIRKIVGDGNTEKVLREIAQVFDGRQVDLLYIDAAHTCIDTFTCYALYRALLRPRYVIFDDITLTDEMARAWSLIQMTVPEGDAVDAATIERDIRPGPGFGVVKLGS